MVRSTLKGKTRTEEQDEHPMRSKFIARPADTSRTGLDSVNLVQPWTPFSSHHDGKTKNSPFNLKLALRIVKPFRWQSGYFWIIRDVILLRMPTILVPDILGEALYKILSALDPPPPWGVESERTPTAVALPLEYCVKSLLQWAFKHNGEFMSRMDSRDSSLYLENKERV